ncbi:MAG: rod shape-determining protein MreC [Patescibacteria group bacterium]
MKKSSTKLGIIFIVAVIGAVFLNKYIAKDGLTFYPKALINLSSFLFIKAENFSGNDELQQAQEVIDSLKAKIDDLENENDFLRRTVRISQKFDHPVVYAGIFNLNFTPAGYNVLLNKGAQDGISEGDVVVTAEGVLVGKIEKVMQNFARVLFVSDPEFKVTAKVVSSGTSGIARGALNEGMYLDFVVQEDEIKEEDMLMSTGNDLFPPALIIGSVDHIEANATQMFKKVRIRPAIKDVQLGRVLVIKR